MKTCLRRLMSGLICVLIPLASGPSQADEARLVRVGVYENPPKILLGPDGQPSGIFGELLRHIADEEDWQLEAVSCNWKACLQQLSEGQIDLLPDVARTPEREGWLGFHDIPALNSWSRAYADTEIESPLDLDGKRVALLAGSVQLSYLRGLAEGFEVKPIFVQVDSYPKAFAAVQQGEADVAFSNHFFGDYFAPDYGLEGTALIFQPSRLFFATPLAQNADLLSRIDHWLGVWRADKSSVYHDILSHWGEAGLAAELPRWLQMMLAGAVLLLSMLVAFVFLLRIQVRSRTRTLATREAQLEGVLAGVESCIFNKDVQLRYTYVNPFFCKTMGQTEAGLLGRTDADLFSAEEAEKIHAADRAVLLSGERSVCEEVVRLPGSQETRTFLSVRVPLKLADGRIWGLCGVSTDITETYRQQERIHQLAWYDSVTHLPNRQRLLQELAGAKQQAEERKQDGAVLFIDLDHFRDLNDAQGYAAGDELLRQVAARLTDRVNERFTLARLGGDEFVLLAEGLDATREQAMNELQQLAQVIIQALAEPFILKAQRHRCGGSIGISLFSDLHEDAEGLLRCAELAMSDAKSAGSNCFRFFDPSMQAQAQNRAELEAGIRVGMEQGQFELWYQPQYDRQQQLLGLEALVRWRHPDKGLISPADFIPVAEETGLIVPLGDQLLEQACQQLVHWQQHSQLNGVPVAVNISARQIHTADFAERVCAVLDRTGASANTLELEVTESMLVKDVEQTIDKMRRLRLRGVRFSLDDFGTGYSSLIFLKQLPLDKLKIDQGFVRDLLSDSNDAAIVKTVVALGQSMDLTVLAEGVETREHCDALAAMGCYEYQGYYFSKPLPPAELEARLAEQVVESGTL